MRRYNLFSSSKKLVKWIGACILYYTGMFFLHKWHLENFNRNNHLIVLRFHRVVEDGKRDAVGLSISSRMFERFVRFLKKHFSIISLDEAVRAIKRGEIFKELTFAVTFDDGYKDNYSHAYELLKQYNLAATIFLTCNAIGRENSFWWDKIELQKKALSENDIALLDWEDIEHMNHGLIDFGSHTLSHPDLTSITLQEAEQEIRESRIRLEQKLNRQVKYFTYPHGYFNSEVRDLVKNSGYEAAFTSKDTRDTSDLFALGRKGINEEIVTDIFGRFSKPLVMFAVLKNVR